MKYLPRRTQKLPDNPHTYVHDRTALVGSQTRCKICGEPSGNINHLKMSVGERHLNHKAARRKIEEAHPGFHKLIGQKSVKFHTHDKSHPRHRAYFYHVFHSDTEYPNLCMHCKHRAATRIHQTADRRMLK